MNLLDAYLRAYTIRRVEEEITARYNNDPQPMRTPVHLSIGQECLAVAVRDAVGPLAHAYSTHRSHAHYLAWGGDLNAMIAELYGKATGCSGGWGGSMHLIDESAGFMGTSAIVGSAVSIAVGNALSAKLKGDDRITVAFAGDAVPETGQFWEALNFAALKQLRLLVVIEDNGLATATPREARQRYGEGVLGMLSWDESQDVQVETLWTPDYDPDDPEDRDTYQNVYNFITGLLEDIELQHDTYPSVWPKVATIPTKRHREHVGVGYDDWRPRVAAADDTLRMLYRSLSDTDTLYMMESHLEIDKTVAAAFAAAEAAPWPERTW